MIARTGFPLLVTATVAGLGAQFLRKLRQFPPSIYYCEFFSFSSHCHVRPPILTPVGQDAQPRHISPCDCPSCVCQPCTRAPVVRHFQPCTLPDTSVLQPLHSGILPASPEVVFPAFQVLLPKNRYAVYSQGIDICLNLG